MEIEWIDCDVSFEDPELEREHGGGWRKLGNLPDKWFLSVLHRKTSFSGECGGSLWETETALRHPPSEYFKIMQGDIRDTLTGEETLEEIRVIVEGGPLNMFEQCLEAMKPEEA